MKLKSETRDPKSERNPKAEQIQCGAVSRGASWTAVTESAKSPLSPGQRADPLTSGQIHLTLQKRRLPRHPVAAVQNLAADSSTLQTPCSAFRAGFTLIELLGVIRLNRPPSVIPGHPSHRKL